MWIERGAGRIVTVCTALVFVVAACTGGDGDEAPAPGEETGVTTTTRPLASVAPAEPPPPPVPGDPAFPPGLYVAPYGDDTNDGLSPAAPFRTIGHGVDQLTPGTTLYILDGVYEEHEREDSGIIIEASGTADAWVRITSYPGHTPVIRGIHKNGLKVEGASYVEISHLTLEGVIDPDNPKYSGAGINVDGIYVTRADGSFGPVANHHVRVIGNTISGFGAGGIPVTGTSHVELRDNVIYDVASTEPTQHSGISIFEPRNPGFGDDAGGYSNYIVGNVVYRAENIVPNVNGDITDGNCVILDRSTITGYEGRTLIANNVCIDNGGRGVQIYQSARADVVHNTLYGNLRSPEVAEEGGELGAFESSDVIFANNLVITTRDIAPARAWESSDVEFHNNIYVADRGGDYDGNLTDNEVVLDGADVPLVVAAAAEPLPRMFDLVVDSAAIDAGTDRFTAVLDRDFAGRRRLQGSFPDVGAFEFPTR